MTLEILYDGDDEKPDDIDDDPRPLPTSWATAERLLAARRGPGGRRLPTKCSVAAKECGACGWDLPHHETNCPDHDG